MTSDRLSLAEAFINILAAVGLVGYLGQIIRNRTRSLLESRVSMLFLNLAVFFAVRGVAYALSVPEEVKTAILFISCYIPLSLVFFIEGLLRRHTHISLKLFSLVTSIGLSLTALTLEQRSQYFFLALASFQFIVIALVMWISFQRDQTQLTEAENRYINGVGMAALIALPLLLTDYRSVFAWEIPRMGAIAGLAFAYSLLNLTEKRRKLDISIELGFIFGIDFVGSVVFCLVWKDFSSLAIAYAIFLALHFFILLVKQLILQNDVKIQDWIFDLVEAIQTRRIRETADFHQLLTDHLGTQSILLLTEEDMMGFNIAALKDQFTGRNGVDLASLKKLPGAPEGAQQMAYLLETHQMNQAHIIGTDPLYLILMHAPAIGATNTYQNEMQILKALLSLIQRRSHEQV